MSWAQIRSAVNSNLSRTLDVLINERMNTLERELGAIGARVTAIDTRSQGTDARSHRQEAEASNVVRLTRGFSPALQFSNANPSMTIARVRFRVPGRYRVVVRLSRQFVFTSVGTRTLSFSMPGNSASVSNSDGLANNAPVPNLVLDFNADIGVGNINISWGHVNNTSFSVTGMDICYNLINVNNHALFM